MTWYYVTTRSFTCGAAVENGTVTITAPILRKFVGQPFANLERWVRSLGGTITELTA